MKFNKHYCRCNHDEGTIALFVAERAFFIVRDSNELCVGTMIGKGYSCYDPLHWEPLDQQEVIDENLDRDLDNAVLELGNEPIRHPYHAAFVSALVSIDRCPPMEKVRLDTVNCLTTEFHKTTLAASISLRDQFTELDFKAANI